MSGQLIGPNGGPVLLCTGIVTLIFGWLWWSSQPQHPRWDRVKAGLGALLAALSDGRPLIQVRMHMSSTEAEDAEDMAATNQGDGPDIERAGADTDAVRAGTTARTGTELVRISRRMSDAELIAVLAVQRAAAGSHRFTANQIAGLIGGTRSEVLDQIRALRTVGEAPVFRPLTPEQQATRERLGLPQR